MFGTVHEQTGGGASQVSSMALFSSVKQVKFNSGTEVGQPGSSKETKGQKGLALQLVEVQACR